MMTKAPQIIYPSKHFAQHVFDAMKNSKKHEIIVNSKWRVKLLRQSIEIWPRFTNDNDRLKSKGKLSLSLSSFALFSLFHNHIRSISNNYQMNYKITNDEIRLTYSLSEPN